MLCKYMASSVLSKIMWRALKMSICLELVVVISVEAIIRDLTLELNES